MTLAQHSVVAPATNAPGRGTEEVDLRPRDPSTPYRPGKSPAVDTPSIRILIGWTAEALESSAPSAQSHSDQSHSDDGGGLPLPRSFRLW